MFNELRESVITGKTRPQSWRHAQLKNFEELLEANENKIINALKDDLGKPTTEAFLKSSH